MSGDDHFIKPDNEASCSVCDGTGEVFRGVGGPDDPERCHACNGTGLSIDQMQRSKASPMNSAVEMILHILIRS